MNPGALRLEAPQRFVKGLCGRVLRGPRAPAAKQAFEAFQVRSLIRCHAGIGNRPQTVWQTPPSRPLAMEASHQPQPCGDTLAGDSLAEAVEVDMAGAETARANCMAEPIAAEPQMTGVQAQVAAAARRRGGKRKWEELRDDRDHLPPGPSTTRGLFNWPESIIDGVMTASGAAEGSELCGDSDCLQRLVGNLKRGLAVTSDYSGMDCPREALERCVSALAKKCSIDPKDLQLLFLRASDKGAMQRSVLEQISHMYDDSRSCVLGDIMGQLPSAAREYIKAASPDKRLDAKLRASAHEDLEQWLYDNRKWVFQAGRQARCQVHHRLCDVMPAPAALPGAIRSNVAGVTCVGWSASGSSEHYAHESEVPHAIWMMSRFSAEEANTEDVFWAECTPRYPSERLASKLHFHQIVSITDGPELHGWLVKRMRSLMFGFSRRRFRWTGPETQEGIAREFAAKFHKMARCTGEVLMCASDQDVQSEYIELARRQQFIITPDALEGLQPLDLLPMILPPGNVMRFNEWHEFRQRSSQPHEVFITDTDHRLGTRGGNSGRDWPVQLRHGSIMLIPHDATQWRLATSWEHLAAQGFNLLPGAITEGNPKSKMAPIFAKLPLHHRKHLSGNAMHLCTQGAFMMYCLSRLDIALPPLHQIGGREDVVGLGDGEEEREGDLLVGCAFAPTSDCPSQGDDDGTTMVMGPPQQSSGGDNDGDDSSSAPPERTQSWPHGVAHRGVPSSSGGDAE